MRFFKRGQSGHEAPQDFWGWWSTGRERVAEAINSGAFNDRLIAEIAAAVGTIHPSMGWELEPGRTSQHAFCISPEGDAAVRQSAIRWLASAPPPDATWEYHASKQPAQRLMGLEVAGRKFDLDDMRAIPSWDPARRRVDVRLWHPGFAAAPDAIRIQVGFIFLDSLLGEDAVERWVGEIDIAEASPGARTPAELRADVEKHQREPAGETWVVRERRTSGGQVEVVSADAAMKRIDHPFHDHHVTIAIVMGIDRMPNSIEAAVLDDEEADLLGRLGDVAVFVGRSTAIGARTMHFVAEEPDRMRPAIDSWAADIPDAIAEDHPQRRLKIDFDQDMDWSFQRELGIR